MPFDIRLHHSAIRTAWQTSFGFIWLSIAQRITICESRSRTVTGHRYPLHSTDIWSPKGISDGVTLKSGSKRFGATGRLLHGRLNPFSYPCSELLPLNASLLGEVNG